MNRPEELRGIAHREPVIFERSRPGRRGCSLPRSFGDATALADLPAELLRKSELVLPEVDEPTVVRHFTRLSNWNHSVDAGMYPLGSCTMKYNPRLNEKLARRAGFADLHPYTPEALCQGALELWWELERLLGEISGFPAVTLQPAAGAHGELTGVKMIRAYHRAQGNARKKILVPDTAHGTNPASSRLAGYEVVEIESGPAGILEPQAVAQVMDDSVAAVMLTNPNTLGLFERHIGQIARIVHEKGGLVYCDGANLNSIVGRARPGDMGVDVMQFNLHKTFSTPHGGGGPGAGPVGVCQKLAPFLPVPRVEKRPEGFRLVHQLPHSIGRMKAFYGNFGVLIRAWAYIRELGPENLRRVCEMAVLNANYLRARLEPHLPVARPERSLHEVIFSDAAFEEAGVSTLDVAKRLLDYGFHPPTVYFPLVVHGAFMVEPTETESPETLDEYAETILAILEEARKDPEILHRAPHHTVVGRLDEVQAAREPVLRWTGPAVNERETT